MFNYRFLPVNIILLSILFLGCSAKEKQIKPNVAIILVDDMGFGDLSCYGNIINTPNIDALAQQGLRFTNFYANSPICSPSRVALTTGQYPMRHKIHTRLGGSVYNKEHALADFLDPAANTVARTLKQNGYATGHFGKWHMGGGRDIGNVPFPSEYGFDESLVSFEGIGNRVLFPNDNLSKQSAKLGKGEIIWAEKHRATSIYVDSALSFINECGQSPFYIHLFPGDVHDPHLPDSSKVEKGKIVTSNPYENRFFAVLVEMDKQIGRFIKELDKMGKLDNTIILLLSDNGPADRSLYYDRKNYPDEYDGKFYPPGSTGHLFGRKYSLYEGGIREPLIVYWKGNVPEGKTDTTTILSSIDLFPSICSLLDIDFPDNLDGTNKRKALLGEPMKKVPPIMFEYNSASNPRGTGIPANKAHISPNLAIRDGDWKLLINVDGTDAKLFNLRRDPGEKRNLIQQQKVIAKKLSAKVINWRKSMPVEQL